MSLRASRAFLWVTLALLLALSLWASSPYLLPSLVVKYDPSPSRTLLAASRGGEARVAVSRFAKWGKVGIPSLLKATYGTDTRLCTTALSIMAVVRDERLSTRCRQLIESPDSGTRSLAIYALIWYKEDWGGELAPTLADSSE